MAKRRPTLVEVAAEAGVALGTASRAMSGHPAVRDETRRRVQAAARKLGYEPNRLARSLRSGNPHFVGVVVPDIANDFYAGALKAMQDVLESEGYQVLVMNSERRAAREREAIKSLLSQEVAGLLIATAGGVADEPPVPTVYFDSLLPGAGFAHVARANQDGIEVLLDHLVGVHGYERIAYIGAPPDVTSAAERLDAFTAGMAARRLPIDPDLIAEGDEAWTPQSGREAMARLLDAAANPEAVLCASDTFSLGAIQATRDRGLRVPRDIALVSFDDPLYGEFIEPRLTALARQERVLGKVAASQLLNALRNGAKRPALNVRIPVELTVRRSCGCADETAPHRAIRTLF
jgi:DNA-binding LacI/PurR family transcriptional regulator